MSQPVREPVGHHPGDQCKMIRVLMCSTHGRGGHDIGRRIDMLTACSQAGEAAINGLKVDRPPRQRPMRILQCLPCFDLIEDLEKDSTKENFTGLLRAVGAILNITNEILTDAVGNAEYIREPVSSQYRIARPRTDRVEATAIKHGQAFNRKSPIGFVSNSRGDHAAPRKSSLGVLSWIGTSCAKISEWQEG